MDKKLLIREALDNAVELLKQDGLDIGSKTLTFEEMEEFAFYVSIYFGDISISVCYYDECIDMEEGESIDDFVSRVLEFENSIRLEANDDFQNLLSGGKDYLKVDIDDQHFSIVKIKRGKINCILYEKSIVPKFKREISFPITMSLDNIKSVLRNQLKKKIK